MRKIKILLFFAIVWGAAFVGSYLSGLAFFWMFKQPIERVDAWLFVRLYRVYSEHSIYGPKLLIAGAIGYFLPFLGLIFVFFTMFRRKKDIPGVASNSIFSRKKNLYGEARFARLGELKKAGFLKQSNTSIVLGKMNGRFLFYSGQQFALLAAPTRSGKGVGIVIPNLLAYQGSVVVLDIKQENFELTSGFRQKYGQEVYLFNPFAEDKKTHRWNPLSYVSSNPEFRMSDLMSIASMLYPVGADGKDRFWMNQAQNAFIAFALYLFDLKAAQLQNYKMVSRGSYQACTIGELFRISTGKGGDLREYLQGLAQSEFLSTQGQTAFAGLLSQSDDTFSNIMGTFKEPLLPWLNPITDAATSADDFLLTDVRKKKMTIYIGIQPNKLAESRLIINLFFSQLINQNTRELPQNNPALKYQCLLLMDEFTSIGRVDILATSVSYMAGYNIRLMPIIQSLAQLDGTYGREASRTLVTNHALQVIYTPREQRDANDYSEMLGYTSIKKTSVSKGGGRGDVNRTENDERRALMLPQELKAMSSDKEIILYEGLSQPIMCDKIRYYLEPEFKKRLLPKVNIPEIWIKLN